MTDDIRIVREALGIAMGDYAFSVAAHGSKSMLDKLQKVRDALAALSRIEKEEK